MVTAWLLSGAPSIPPTLDDETEVRRAISSLILTAGVGQVGRSEIELRTRKNAVRDAQGA